MALEADRVVVELFAKTDQFDRRIKQSATSFDSGMDRIAGSATRAEGKVVKFADNVNTKMSAARVAVTSFGVALLSTLSVGAIAGISAAFVGLADKGKQLDAQLRLATATFGNFGNAQADVRRIAMETRAPLEETARLYSTLLRSANELGISQQDAARATETISKAFLISGASAVDAAQGTRQLIQAIQSGTLRGDEFNSIMENAPRLARLFADALDVPVKQLRSLAEQGKITSQELLNALTQPQFAAALDAEFKKLPVTFDQAMTQIGNAAQITFSAFDRGGEFSNMLVAFVMSGAESFAELEARAEVMGGNLSSTISALYNVFDPMGDNAISVMGMIEGAVANLRMLIGGTLRDLQNLYNAVPSLANRIRQNGRNAGIGFAFGADTPLADFADRFQQDARRGDVEAARRRIMRGNPFGEFPASSNRGTFIPSPPSTSGSRRRSRGKSAEQIASEAERRAQRAEREEEAFQREIENLNQSLLQARAATAIAAEDVYRYQVQIVEAERDNAKAAIDRQASGVDRKYTEAQAEELKLKQDQIAAARLEKLAADERHRIAQEKLAVAKAEQQNDIDLAQAQAKFLRTREMQRDAALNILDLQYQMERLELEAVLASERSTDAQKKIAEERLRILGTLQAYDAKAIERDHMSPGRKALHDLETQAMNVNDELESLAVDKVHDLQRAFGDAAAAGLGLKGTIGEIVSELIQMAFRSAILIPLMRALFGGGAGGGVIPGGLSDGSNFLYGDPFGSAKGNIFSAGAPVPFASGGIVNSPTIFPMSNGAGLMGEAGPEAIMPLGRDSQGRLGVRIANDRAASPWGGGQAMVIVGVQANDYFEGKILQVTGPVIAQASTRAAQGGAALARESLARKTLHRLG
jgi:lambda family phage tail tape measure protein